MEGLEAENKFNLAMILGTDRFKYHQQPLSAPRKTNENKEFGAVTFPMKLPSLKTHFGIEKYTHATQTQFRDGETQTDPWDPPFYIYPGGNESPEVLELSSLKYGDGLPVGVLELEMIERMRERRAAEAELLLYPREDALKRRLELIEEQEREDWALREKEIEMMQEEHVKMLEVPIQRQWELFRQSNLQRLNQRLENIQKTADEQKNKVEVNVSRAIRRIEYKHNLYKATWKKERRDIIAEYADYSSPVYAPLARMGKHVTLLSTKKSPSSTSEFMTTLKGMKDFEQWLDEKGARLIKVKVPKEKKSTLQSRYEKKLQELSDVMSKRKRVSEPTLLSLPPCLRIRETEQPDQIAIAVPSITFDLSDRDHASVIVQKFLRGRAVQRKMFLGKELSQGIIDELHSIHAVCDAESEVRNEKAYKRFCYNKEKLIKDDKDLIIESTKNKFWQSSIACSVDLLSKESQRLQLEQSICLISVYATLQRELREAEETWRRKREEDLRDEDDRILRQILSQREDAMEKYRDYLIADRVATLAEEQEKIEMKAFAGIGFSVHVRTTHDYLNDCFVQGVNDAAEDAIGNVNEFAQDVIDAHRLTAQRYFDYLSSEEQISEIVEIMLKDELTPIENKW